jgi:hypothetical protein
MQSTGVKNKKYGRFLGINLVMLDKCSNFALAFEKEAIRTLKYCSV